MSKLLISVAPWIIMFGVFWFIFIRPQRNKQQQHEEMIAKLEQGDQVITIGGIKGQITEVKDDELELKIASEVEINISRNSVRSLAEEETAESEEA
ncbi:preprotein translocase subunit YajC [Halanaerobaculum tunisiense]